MLKKYKFKKELYSKESLIKAAYNYIDDFYLHLDCDDEYYIVEIEDRDQFKSHFDADNFKNEMLIQETRKIVNDRTINIREMMYSRALASTIIDERQSECVNTSEDAEKILVDWFEENE